MTVDGVYDMFCASGINSIILGLAVGTGYWLHCQSDLFDSDLIILSFPYTDSNTMPIYFVVVVVVVSGLL